MLKHVLDVVAQSGAVLSLQSQFGQVSVASWHRAACALLAACLLYIVATALWLLVPQAEPEAAPAVLAQLSSAKSAGGSQVDVEALQRLNLFGVADGGAVIEEQRTDSQPEVDLNAQPTRLKLQLQGIIHTSDPKDALAIIVAQGKQDQYAINDKLPVGRVTLAKVMQDHVILDNAGRFESLWLFGDDAKPASGRSQAVSRPAADSGKKDLRNNSKATSLAKSYRQRLYKNPSSLAEVIRVSPAQKGGEMVGYRISPGRDKEQFKALGLAANDIVTSINGIAMNDPSKAMEVYKIMRSAREAQLTVQRAGNTVEVLVSLDDSSAGQ